MHTRWDGPFFLKSILYLQNLVRNELLLEHYLKFKIDIHVLLFQKLLKQIDVSHQIF